MKCAVDASKLLFVDFNKNIVWLVLALERNGSLILDKLLIMLVICYEFIELESHRLHHPPL